jgi:hypothetical protein
MGYTFTLVPLPHHDVEQRLNVGFCAAAHQLVIYFYAGYECHPHTL